MRFLKHVHVSTNLNLRTESVYYTLSFTAPDIKISFLERENITHCRLQPGKDHPPHPLPLSFRDLPSFSFLISIFFGKYQ